MQQEIQQIRNSRASFSEAGCRAEAHERYPSRTVWLETVLTVSYITVLLDSVKRDASARRRVSCVGCRHPSRHAEQGRASAPAVSMLPFRLRAAIGPGRCASALPREERERDRSRDLRLHESPSSCAPHSGMSLPQPGGTSHYVPPRPSRQDGPPCAVLFDFGGTLDADGVPWSQRFYIAYRAAGGSLRPDLFDELFKASDRALERLEGIGSLGFRAMIDAQAELLRASLPDGGAIDAGAMAEHFHTESLRMIDRNRELLTQLQRDHRLAVISNFTGNLERCLDEVGLLHFFGAVTDSAIVGGVKPSPELFVDTLRALGVPPERAWMVGDNFEADIRPALQLGLRACWLASPGRAAPAGCEPSARIARLPELHGVLAHGALCTD